MFETHPKKPKSRHFGDSVAELIFLKNHNFRLFSSMKNSIQMTRILYRLYPSIMDHLAYRVSFRCDFTKLKNVDDERGRETSHRIDEVAGAFGQDILKWPRRWHRLLESIQQNSSRR